jgi:hypothetical protein
MSGWYCSVGGQAYGPYDREQMEEMLRSRRISEKTPVWNSDWGEGLGWTAVMDTDLSCPAEVEKRTSKASWPLFADAAFDPPSAPDVSESRKRSAVSGGKFRKYHAGVIIWAALFCVVSASAVCVLIAVHFRQTGRLERIIALEREKSRLESFMIKGEKPNERGAFDKGFIETLSDNIVEHAFSGREGTLVSLGISEENGERILVLSAFIMSRHLVFIREVVIDIDGEVRVFMAPPDMTSSGETSESTLIDVSSEISFLKKMSGAARVLVTCRGNNGMTETLFPDDWKIASERVTRLYEVYKELESLGED